MNRLCVFRFFNPIQCVDLCSIYWNYEKNNRILFIDFILFIYSFPLTLGFVYQMNCIRSVLKYATTNVGH